MVPIHGRSFAPVGAFQLFLNKEVRLLRTRPALFKKSSSWIIINDNPEFSSLNSANYEASLPSGALSSPSSTWLERPLVKRWKVPGSNPGERFYLKYRYDYNFFIFENQKNVMSLLVKVSFSYPNDCMNTTKYSPARD